MEKSKYWLKYICYFLIGFLIITIFSSITQVEMLKELNIEINIKTIVLNSMKSELVLYTILYFFILILNVLYNVRLIKKLNEESEKLRKAGEEKILKERRKLIMKKNVLILILVVLIIFLIIFIVNTKRKSEILEQYTKAVEQRLDSTNYYIKTINNEENIIEIIAKDNIKVYKEISKDGIIRILYQEGDKATICITETSGKKTAVKVENGIVPVFSGGDSYFDSIYKVESLWGKIKLILETKVTTEILNGKECYKFFVSKELLAYVNKEDMVSIKSINGSTTKEYVEYKFGTVTDEDIEKIKPNLDEYIFQENEG